MRTTEITPTELIGGLLNGSEPKYITGENRLLRLPGCFYLEARIAKTLDIFRECVISMLRQHPQRHEQEYLKKIWQTADPSQRKHHATSSLAEKMRGPDAVKVKAMYLAH